MTRATLKAGEQPAFLAAVKEATGLTWLDLARHCGVDRRTLLDWRQEAYRISYEALLALQQLSGVSMPEVVALESDVEARRKSANPDLYPSFNNRKRIQVPEKTRHLAELVGILLGDGGITDYQVKVSSNRKREAGYSCFISELITDLFGLETRTIVHGGTRVVILSSVAAVEYLLNIGLRKGSKVKAQVGVPRWVFSDHSFMQACARGLMDTDGGPYRHVYTVREHRYEYVKLCFTNHSLPLLADLNEILGKLGYTPKSNGRSTVSLYRQAEVRRYYARTGTNNPYHLRRFVDYANQCWGDDLTHIPLANQG